jgi:hypothetical protein
MSKFEPPIVVKRNAFGLLENEKITFVFEEDGIINWRARINKKWLYPNPSSVEKGLITRNASVETLKDSDLCIKLFGLKELAQIRGFNSLSYRVDSASSDYVAVTCKIDWKPNYETENMAISYEALADAHYSITKSFARAFLMATAENRAFSRCVRSFLKINIVSQEELGDAKILEEAVSSNENPTSPQVLLEKVMKEKKSIEVEIDKGSPHAQKYVFHGEADEAPNVDPGDVIVIVEE